MSHYYGERIIYPPGVKDLTEDISTAELHRRLKVCREVLQTLNQEDDNAIYRPLALYLASDFFLEHRNCDIRLIVACCIADVFRIFAPDHPYIDPHHLKAIFMLFIDTLKGLASSNDTNLRSHFYLLENLSVVKTFNLFADAEDASMIVMRIFEEMFHLISVTDNAKMRGLILTMLVGIVKESDSLPKKVVEFILLQLILPNREKNRRRWLFAQDLIKATAVCIESYSRPILNELLNSEYSKDSYDSEDNPSDIFSNAYDLMFQLNLLIPSAMIGFVNDLVPKLQCTIVKTRLEVTRLLSSMFANKSSKMIEQNKSLWVSYLGRYNDVMPEIRKVCLEYSKSIYLHHPESRQGIRVWLEERALDHNENVRKIALRVIMDLAIEDFSWFEINFYGILTERVLDTNFEVAELAVRGLVQIYQKRTESCGSFPACLKVFSPEETNVWNKLKTNIVKRYFIDSQKNRQLVEEIYGEYIVPHTAPMEQKVKLFYQMYCAFDDYCARGFSEMLKQRKNLRGHVKKLTEVVQYNMHDIRLKYSTKIASVICCFFPNPEKMHGIATRLSVDLEDNAKLRSIVCAFVEENITCDEALSRYNEIFQELTQSDNSREPPEYLDLLRKMLSRIMPLFDKKSILFLVSFVINSITGDGSINADMCLKTSPLKGLNMLKALSVFYPDYFRDGKTYGLLLPLLHSETEIIIITALQILVNISNHELSNVYPAVFDHIVPRLVYLSEYGNPLQAKHSVLLLNKIIPENNRRDFFRTLMRTLHIHFTLESEHIKTALVSSGHIAQSWRHLFPCFEFKKMVTFVVKEVLMHNKAVPRSISSKWDDYESLPDDTKVKIEGMKCIVRWLTGVEKFVKPAVTTFRCFNTYLEYGGDLTESKHISPMENSWLRLSAACRILKLCHVPLYAAELSLKQFQTLAYVLLDPCPQVRSVFALKLNKALQGFKLPTQFLAVFAVGGLNEDSEFKNQLKQYIIYNVKKRRQRLNQTTKHTNDDILNYLPDYALPYAIHLLAHAPFFTDHMHIPTLLKIRECLRWFMEMYLDKENYSCSFFKRLVENIKQTKDMLDPEDEKLNNKLYAVCDLALNIILSKKRGTLRDFPGDPVLNRRFFTNPDPTFSNMKIYLPRELLRKLGVNLDLELAVMSQDQSSSVHQEGSIFSVLKDQDKLRSENEKTTLSSENESVQSHLQNENSHLEDSDESNTSLSKFKQNKTQQVTVERTNGIISKHSEKSQDDEISNSEITTFSDDEKLDLSGDDECTLNTWSQENGNSINSETEYFEDHMESTSFKENKLQKTNFTRKRGRPPTKHLKMKQNGELSSSNLKYKTAISSDDETMESLSNEKESVRNNWLSRSARLKNNDSKNVSEINSRKLLDQKSSAKGVTITRKRGRPPGKHSKVSKEMKNSLTTSGSEEMIFSDYEKNTNLFKNKSRFVTKKSNSGKNNQTNNYSKSVFADNYKSKKVTTMRRKDTGKNNVLRKRGRPPKIHNKNKFAKTSLSILRSTATSSDEESFSDSSFNCSSQISVNISDTASIRRLIKECKVSLRTNEIEQYTRKFPLRINTINSIDSDSESSDSTNVEKCLSENVSSFKLNHHLHTRAGRKTRKVENDPVMNKRNKKTIVKNNNIKVDPKAVERIENSSGKKIPLRDKKINEKSKPTRR